VMRTTLLGGLLDAAGHASRHGVERIALFESGRVYLQTQTPFGQALSAAPEGATFAGETAPPAHEPHLLGCLACGPLAPTSWKGEARAAEFFELKGVLESLAAELLVGLGFEARAEPFLHPGKAASVLLDGGPIGWLGELHPLVLREWDLEAGAGFTVDLDALLAASEAGRERYEDVTTYPSVHEDIAVVVEDTTGGETVRRAVLAGGGELLRSAEIFDLYHGPQVGEGRKSLALRLEFRAPDRTLTDEEVAEARKGIEAGIGEIGGSLRE
jgi:phenylalanyl-tRNA synthetase beta chain